MFSNIETWVNTVESLLEYVAKPIDSKQYNKTVTQRTLAPTNGRNKQSINQSIKNQDR
jgi:hypothetical protein